MTISKTLMVLNLLMPMGIALAAGPALESGTAACEPGSPGALGCELRWDLSATPRATYTVEWLNPETGQWQAAFRRPFALPYASARGLPAGRLYRVTGCDDVGRKRNCVSTTAFWSPIVSRKTSDIPASVPIATAGGEHEYAAISKEAHLYTQIMQLNVYLLADLLGRAVTAELPPMTAPLEPGTPGDMAHDVHHNVYAAYEAERAIRDRGPAMMDAGR